jgi:ketosteroid isomerase-like protein
MDDIRRSIDEANRRFVDTFNAGDPGRAAQQVYTRTARILPPDSDVVEGREEIVRFWQGAAQQLGVKAVALTTISLEVLPEAVCEIGHADLTLAAGQQARFKYVVVWKQDEGRWGWHIDIWNGRP